MQPQAKPSLNRHHLQPAPHRGTAVEPCLQVNKAVEADELARFVKADEVAHPAEQRNIDAVVSAHHPVAARKPFVEDTERARWFCCAAVARALVGVELMDKGLETIM